MQATASIETLAYASATLVLFMWFCGTITTYVRGHAMESPNREDGPVMAFFNLIFHVPRGRLTVLPDNRELDTTVNRWMRITANNTANIPPALIVFLMAATTGSLPEEYLIIAIWVFVIARILHTISYAVAIQPFRTIFYATGATSMGVVAISLFVSTN